jgi:hypothetical protein
MPADEEIAAAVIALLTTMAREPEERPAVRRPLWTLEERFFPGGG